MIKDAYMAELDLKSATIQSEQQTAETTKVAKSAFGTQTNFVPTSSKSVALYLIFSIVPAGLAG